MRIEVELDDETVRDVAAGLGYAEILPASGKENPETLSAYIHRFFETSCREAYSRGIQLGLEREASALAALRSPIIKK